MEEDKLNMRVSPTIASLKLMHKDRQATMGKPMTMANAKAIDHVVGICISNSRYKKTAYSFRD